MQLSKIQSMTAWAIALAAIVIIAVVVAWPFVVMLALNTLFPLLSIPYSFSTWLAVIALNITYFYPKFFS